MSRIFFYWDVFLSKLISLPKSCFSLPASSSLFKPRLSTKEQIIFLKRLAMMLRANMPIIDSLIMIGSESSSKSLKIITKTVINDVSTGQTFSNSLRSYKNSFGFFVLSIIAVGEKTGTLAQSLEYIATELKKKQELHTQIIGALIYPAIVIMATLAITLFLIVYIFPKIVPIFLSVKTTLPWSTRFLISLSDFLSTYEWYLLGIFSTVIIVTPFLLRLPRIEYVATVLLLKLPVIGKLFRYYNLAQIARTLGLLLSTDVPLLTALDITGRSTGNIVYREAVTSAVPVIAMGKNIASTLSTMHHLFPPLLLQMIQAGERTGNVPTALSYVSELYESDIRDLTRNLTTIIEPVLMLIAVVAALVGKAAAQPASPVQIMIGKDEAIQIKMKTAGVPSNLSTVAADVVKLEPKVKSAALDAVPVVISADKSIKYETVVKVMDSLQKAGVSRVGLSVQTGK